MLHHDVQFFSDGIRLAAEVYVPDGIEPGEKRPGLVMCHGFGATKSFFLADFARFFCEAGFVALTFDYRGFGERVTSRQVV